MPNWTTLTLAELRAAGHPTGKIVSEVAKYLNSKTKKEVIELLMDTEIFSRPAVVTKRHDGQMERRKVETENALGDKTGGTVTTYTYYPNGDIEDITIVHRDGDGNITEQYTIHHYQDGRQPIRIEG